MYTECIVSHLLALFFYAAKKPELHSNKKKLLLMMNLNTNLAMREKRSRTSTIILY